MKKAALLVVAAWFIAFPAAAQTWTGAGPDNNWSTGANWSGGVAPASGPTTQLTFPVFSGGGTPVVDLPWTVNQLFFLVSPYRLSGQPITFDGAGANVLIAGGFETIDNPIVLAVAVGISGSANFIRLNGPISGPGSLIISGTGGTTLTATSTFTGGTSVGGAGILRLDGSLPGPVMVEQVGVLGGFGNVAGPVTISGSSATLSPFGVFGTGNLGFPGGGALAINIDGPARGTQYGSVNVTGTVDVSAGSLRLSGAYVPVVGDVFTIMVNDEADAVTGTFANLPEGETVLFNGVPLRISYSGGTGNDVTLTAVAAIANLHQVPMLSQWGMILLASLLLVIGMSNFRERTRK